jgi:hypothetical protein
VTSKVEEVIPHTNVFDAEHSLPDLEQGRLQIIPGVNHA